MLHKTFWGTAKTVQITLYVSFKIWNGIKWYDKTEYKFCENLTICMTFLSDRLQILLQANLSKLINLYFPWEHHLMIPLRTSSLKTA